MSSGNWVMPMSLSSCPKLKQGQLLMQRYYYCFMLGTGKYKQQGDECKRKSRILAARMKAHARACPNCSPDEEDFYGIEQNL